MNAPVSVELQLLLKHLPKLPEHEKRAILNQLNELARLKDIEKAQTDFLTFVKRMWPVFIAGRHHEKMARAFERVARGELKRLIINMPPRHTKSEFASWLLPSWFLGKFPHKKVIQTSHTAELAVGFGRKVRNLVDSPAFLEVFPEVSLQSDSKAAGRWNTNKGGDYFAIGVGGAVTGKGADILIIDDPHSEQEAALAETSPEIYDKVYEWFTSGPRQRLQPGGAIIIVMTRWGMRDLTGQVLKAANQRGGDEWEVIEFPALFDDDTEDPRPLWPEFWSLEEMLALKEELPSHKWNAQYQQAPTSKQGAIVKADWWRPWEQDYAPQCEFIIQSWDTAFEKTNRADYTACTTWGVWYPEKEPNNPASNVANIILLDAFKDRMEFPELKETALKHYKKWSEMDSRVAVSVIVEKKASGAPLIYELRSMGIPVQEYTPSKGNDKISRLNAVADLFSSGLVWAPETRWAEEVIDEVTAFPAGEHDDMVDATTLALMRFRQGGYVRLPSDEPEPIRYFKSKRNQGYY